MAVVVTERASEGYVRRLSQSRWSGDTRSLVQLAADAANVIIERTHQEPDVVVTLYLPRNDEDHFRGLDNISAALNQLEVRDLERIQKIRLEAGPKDGDTTALHISIDLSRDAPAVQGEVRGKDQDLVNGIRTRLDEAVDRSRPRVPAAPHQVTYFVALFLLFMYGFGLAATGLLDWIPDNILGAPLYFVILFGSSIALSYFIFWLVNRVLLRPLDLRTADGKRPGIQPKRVLGAAGALALALFPIFSFVFEQLTKD